MAKRTLGRKKNRQYRKVHGFLSRMRTKAGRQVLKRRRAKGRKLVAVSTRVN